MVDCCVCSLGHLDGRLRRVDVSEPRVDHEGDSAGRGRHGREHVIRFSANLGFLWKDPPLPAAIRAAKAAGFDAVECHSPVEFSTTDVNAALTETGLSMLGINTRRGNPRTGDNGLAAIPGREVEARGIIVEALDYACAISASAVHVMAGNVTGPKAHDTFLANLDFAATAAAMYLASTIYHALPRNKTKEFFRLVDHAAIYLLIAGTYTPFTLGVLRGTVGTRLFALIWTLAVAGVLWKLISGVRYKFVSTALYLVMGWVGLIAAKPMLELMPTEGILWILAGGLGYTLGVPFYVARRVRYSHFVWHLFVLTGTACHFVAVLVYSG